MTLFGDRRDACPTTVATRRLLDELARSGITLQADGENLRLQAPKGALTPELKSRIAEAKPAILEYLSAVDSVGARHAVPLQEMTKVFVESPRDSTHPLSFAQERLWFLDRLDGPNAAYIITACLQLDGPLDAAILARALDEIVRRHEALRTVFVDRGGEGRAVIEEQTAFRLERIDASAEADPESAARQRVEEATRGLFDLTAGPLIRATLVRVAPTRHILAFSLHHIIADGWSTSVLLAELAVLYEAYVAGRESPLSPPRIQYRDFTRRQRLKPDDAAFETSLAYWKEELAGAAHQLELPTDRPRPAVQSYRGAVERFTIPADLVARLDAFSRSAGATRFMMLFAIHAALLHRYSGQESILVSSPVANRDDADLEALVGMVVNTIVLRAGIADSTTFRELLDAVGRTAREALDHQGFPFEKLVAEVAPERDLSRAPLAQVSFALQNTPPLATRFGDIEVGLYKTARAGAITDLYLSFEERGGVVIGEWEYATDLFDAATIRRMIGHFLKLAASAIEDPAQPIGRMDLLSGEERERILVEWNRTEAAWPAHRTIVDLVEEQADRTPDAVALVATFGAEAGFGSALAEIAFRELDIRANRLAHRLRRLGVGPETLVGVCLPRTADLIVALLAILKAGGAYVPLDPAYPPERIRFMAEDASLRVIVSRSDLAAGLPDGTALLALDEEAAAIAEESPDRIGASIAPENLAYVIYTSGSTGRPKGIMIEHRNTVAFLSWARCVFTAEELSGTLFSTSICFDLSIFEIFLPLITGGTVILAENALALPGHPAAHRITMVNTVPSAMAELVRSGGIPRSVVTVNLAGEPLKARLADDVYGLGHVRNVNDLYGPGEDTTYSTRARREPGGRETIGRPIANTRAFLFDRQGQLVPVGVPGEIHLAGAGVTRGYLNRPELTAERYVMRAPGNGDGGAGPFERMYRTGDLGRWLEDGAIEYLGRIDHQVKIRGHRIELGEIEAAILGQPGVRECVVDARDDGRGGKRLVAYVVRDDAGVVQPDLDSVEARHVVPLHASPGLDDERPRLDLLRDALRLVLPSFMIPSSFVLLDALPLTPNGKIDRKALPDPDGVASHSSRDFEAPQGEAEEILTGIWSEVLGRERIGRDENFFEIGGDSIISLRIVARARQAGLAIEPADLFRHQTVAALAAAARPACAPIAGPRPQGETALSPIQCWFFETDRTEIRRFNQFLSFAVAPHLEDDAIARAVERVGRHHDAFRLRFSVAGGVARAWYAEETSVGFETMTVRDDSEVAAIPAWLGDGMNLEEGPLFRAALVAAPLGRRLVLAAHHLIVDGVSWRIIIEDLLAALAGASTLPPSRTSYQEWVEGLRRLAACEGERGRSARLMAGDVETPSMEPGLHGGTDRVVALLDESVTTRLLVTDRDGRTARPREILVAALGAALAGHFDREDFLINLEGHGREAHPALPGADPGRTVGWFTSLYPVAIAWRRGFPDEENLRGIVAALDEPPINGLVHGVLRYLAPEEETRAALARFDRPGIVFNYLGRFDHLIPADAGLALLPDASGLDVSPGRRRAHGIEISAAIFDGRLRFEIEFDRASHDRSAIERLLASIRDSLARLVVAPAGALASSIARNPGLSGTMIVACLAAAGIDPEGVESVDRLSPVQAGIFFHARSAGDPELYMTQMSFRFTASIDPAALDAAWRRVTERHTALRTIFRDLSSGELVQIVLRNPEVGWRFEEWTGQEDVDSRLESFLQRDRSEEFDWERRPPVRLALIRTEAGDSHAVLTAHHAILDGWSMAVLARDLVECLDAEIEGRAPRLDPARPYRDYLSHLGGRPLDEAEEFWRAELANEEAPPAFPLLRRPSGPPRHGEERRRLDPVVSDRLRAAARRVRITFNTFLEGAWCLLLARMTGCDDLVFGGVTNGRPADLEGVDAMVGLFIQTVPIRARIDATARAAAWLAARQARRAALERHAHAPLVQMRAWSGAGPETPLFDHLMLFENYPVSGTIRGQGARIDPASVRSFQTTNYPMSLVVLDGSPLEILVLHDLSRLSTDDAGTVLDLYHQVLVSLAETLERDGTLGDVDLLAPSAGAFVLVECNRTKTDYPRDASLVDLFAEVAARRPGAIALEFQGAGMTYGELNDRADRRAAQLGASGVGPGDFVGICLERSFESIVGTLAILKAGAAYVPLDPGYPDERLALMIEDAGARVVISAGQAKERLEALVESGACRIVGMTMDDASPNVTMKRADAVGEAADPPIVTMELADAVGEAADPPIVTMELADAVGEAADPPIVTMEGPRPRGPDHVVTAESPAYVMYTSGSTGRPKGSVIPHRAVVRLVRKTNFMRFSPEDVFLQLAPTSFDAATLEIWGPLLNGGKLVIAPPGPLTPSEIGALVEARGVTSLWLTASLFNLVVDEGLERLGSLRYLLAGGDVLSVAHVNRVLRELPRCRFINGYGPTENTTFTCCYEADPRRQYTGAIPIGTPIANTTVYILDAEQRPVPVGVPGELYTGGDGLAIGYLNQPELTAERFVEVAIDDFDGADPIGADPVGAGLRPAPTRKHAIRLYRTGDLCRWRADGNIEFLGRIDGQVKIRGFRVEPGEIESALLGAPGVREAAVVVRGDGAARRLVAYVVLDGAVHPDLDSGVHGELLAVHVAQAPSPVPCVAGVHSRGRLCHIPPSVANNSPCPLDSVVVPLREYLKRILPPYMIPDAFLHLDAMPMTPSGKIDRRALPDIEDALHPRPHALIAPRTPDERRLAEAWSAVLDVADVGAEDDFFALGGNSIAAMRLHARLRAAAGPNWTLANLFAHPILAEQATLLAPAVSRLVATPPSSDEIMPADRSRPLPLSFQQQRLWFLEKLEGPNATYNIPACAFLDGPLDASALETALTRLIERHEPLRSRFEETGSGAPRAIAPRAAINLEHVDLSNEQDPSDVATRLAEEMARTPISLLEGPLFRARLVRLAPERHALLLLLHHVVADGWSMNLLLEDLAALYEAAIAGRAPELAPLPIQYGDYALWQRERWDAARAAEEIGFWRAHLAGAPQRLDLPADRPRPARQSYRGATERFALDAGTTRHLRALARDRGATLFHTLLAVFVALLHRLTGEKTILVGTPTANRGLPELERLIGFFVNTVVIRGDLEPATAFTELMARLGRESAEALGRQELPFERLVTELKPERTMGAAPIFQVMFGMNDVPAMKSSFGGLDLIPMRLDRGAAMFDLNLQMTDIGETIEGTCEYATDLFDPATIREFLARYAAMVEAVIGNPDVTVARLPLILPAEERRVLRDWNETRREYPLERTLMDLFEEQVERTPDAVAVEMDVDGDLVGAGLKPGPTEMTYHELDARANRIGHHLRSLGVGPDAIVGVLMERSIEMVEALYGILKAGGAYLPLDLALPVERLRFMIRDAAPRVILTTARLLDRLGVPVDDGVAVIALDRIEDQLEYLPAEPPDRGVAPEDLAYVIYTSGSTGEPKGAMNTQIGIVNRLLWMQEAYPLGADDVVLQKTPYSFDVSVWEFFWPLLAGARLAVARPGEHGDPRALAGTIERHKVTTIHFVPSMLRSFLEAAPLARCRSLRRVITSGEELTADVRDRFFERMEAALHNLYGPTEAAVDVTAWTCAREETGPVPIGRPIANVRIHILDEEGRPVPPGVAGEIHIGGVCLARGYLNRPELTAERFVEVALDAVDSVGRMNCESLAIDAYSTGGSSHPDGTPVFRPALEKHASAGPVRRSEDRRSEDHGFLVERPFQRSVRPAPTLKQTTRLYRSGDLGRYRRDGAIEFLGRIDHQVKIRGHRIELGEIESVLGAQPDVRECAVIVRQDASGDKRLAAFVVSIGGIDHPTANAELSVDPVGAQHAVPLHKLSHHDLRTALDRILPAAMIPSFFVSLPALPRTASGKIDRRSLAQIELSAPVAAAPARPRGVIEEGLVSIWSKTLGRETVGVNENFFDIGGHSLLAIEVQTRIREELEVDLELVELFEHPTIRDLAGRISRDGRPRRGGSRTRPYRNSDDRREHRSTPIAIIGMAGRFPGASGIEEFWTNLVDGRESIRFFTPEELIAAGESPALVRDPRYVPAHGALAVDPAEFDAAFFDIPPREAEMIDPQQRLFLEVAWELFERAGIDPRRESGSIGVFAGAGMSSYAFRNLAARRDVQRRIGAFQLMLANDKDFLATRVSYKLGLRGPSVNVQTACSTSLVAAHYACESLRSGASDLAIAGGVTIRVPQAAGYIYEEGMINSPDGHCRAFDARANGTVGGSGCAAVLLKRLDDALADGDHLHAVIRGGAVNNDGAGKVGFTAPSVEGQAAVVAEAIEASGVDPAAIRYLEAHGTGTPIGDPIEVAALRRAWGDRVTARSACSLGSVKTNVGHLDAAAGVTGLIKAALVVERGVIPGTLHFESPNPGLDLAASPFVVHAETRAWPDASEPRVAAVSSFGIGGTNAHLILEAAPDSPRSAPARLDSERPVLLCLSARTPSALEASSKNLADALEAESAPSLEDLAATLAEGRRRFEERRFAVASTRAEASSLLRGLDKDRLFSRRNDAEAHSVVFLFSGQGSQYPGMAAGLHRSEPVFREVFDSCAGILLPRLGYDLREILHPPRGQEEEIAKRLLEQDGIQSALCAVEIATARLWLDWGVEPTLLIGHSIGDFAAACIAGVLSLEDALIAVAERGRLMQATPEGGLVAVRLAEADLAARLPEDLSIAAINSPGLCVVSGARAEVEAFADRLGREGVEVRPIPVRCAVHSALLDPILDEFRSVMGALTLRPPVIPLVSNLSGRLMTDEEATSPDYWTEHLRRPVRFLDGLAVALADPKATLLEVGPGRALVSAARRHPALGAGHALVTSIRHPEESLDDARVLREALGHLWTAGVEPDWHAVGGSATPRRRRAPSMAPAARPDILSPRRRRAPSMAPAARPDILSPRRVLLPTYPFERRRYWIDRPDRTEEADLDERRPLEEWFAVPSWERTAWPTSIIQRSFSNGRSCETAQDDPLQSSQGRARVRAGHMSRSSHSALRPAGTRALPSQDREQVMDEGYSSFSSGERRRSLVFDQGTPLGEALAETLRQGGASVAIARRGESFQRRDDGSFVVGDRVEDYELLFAVLANEGALPDLLIHAFNVAPPFEDGLAPDAIQRGMEPSFFSLLFIAQALGATARPCRLVVAATGLVRVDGSESIDPVRALLLGPSLSMPQEHEHLSSVVVDVTAALDDPRAAAERLIAEADAPEEDAIVAHRGRFRWRRSFASFDPPVEASDSIRAGGTYLLTGGLGGIGLELARLIADSAPAPLLALVDRSELPPRAEWPHHIAAGDDPIASDEARTVARRIRIVRELEEAGAEVMTFALEISDSAALARVLDEVRARRGRIDGVIHAAGVAGGGLLAGRTRESVMEEFAAKVRGTAALLDALNCPPMTCHSLLTNAPFAKTDPSIGQMEGPRPRGPHHGNRGYGGSMADHSANTAPDFIILCSSTNALVGGLGQSVYASANAFLDACAEAPPFGGARLVSINWDRWQGTGMAAPAERLHFRLTGEALEGGITPDEGREILRRVLAARTERIVVAPRPIKGLVAAMRRYQRDLVATSSDAGARDAEERRPEEYEAPATDLERRIAAEWQGVLGVTGIGRNDEYGRLGGDSLIAVRLVARLKEALGVPLSIRTLYDAPTVARLAREVEALRGGTDAAGRETETGEI